MIILCPTFENNLKYKEKFFDHDEDVIVITPDIDLVDEWLRIVWRVYKGTHPLIILDDCACTKTVKNRTDNLTKLGFSGRHDGLSVWVLTQQYTSISKAFRDNIGFLVLFYTPNKEDLKGIINNCGMDVTKEEMEEYIKQLKENQYSKLLFKLTYPYEIKYMH